MPKHTTVGLHPEDRIAAMIDGIAIQLQAGAFKEGRQRGGLLHDILMFAAGDFVKHDDSLWA